VDEVESWRIQVGKLFARYPAEVTEDFFPDLCAFLRDGVRPAIDDGAIDRAQMRLHVGLPRDFLVFIQRFGGMPAPSLGAPGSRFLREDELARYADEQSAPGRHRCPDRRLRQQSTSRNVFARARFVEHRRVNAIWKRCVSAEPECNVRRRQRYGGMVARLPFLPGAMRFPSFTELLTHQLAMSIQMVQGILDDAG
jgi:hypothetical protein